MCYDFQGMISTMIDLFPLKERADIPLDKNEKVGINMKDIQINTSLSQTITVDESMLASRIGSGIVDVYATPMMIACMENTAATCLSQFLDEGETSVGMMMNTTHEAATPVGMKVQVKATITSVERKKVSFHIEASDEKDVIGKANHDRYIVDKAKFEMKAKQKAAN